MVFGIDGMDFEFVQNNFESLPFLNRLLTDNNNPRLRSVFPADTTPAWSTIYTGLDPSEHGIINFVNVGDKENKYKGFEFNDEAFKGKTFWDLIGEKGYKTTVIFPMNIKNGWETNGLFITRPYDGKISILPKEERNKYNPSVRIMQREMEYVSERKLKLVKKSFEDKFNEEYRVTKIALQNEKWDLFFSYFSTLDGIQHAFWRHCDYNHPNYPGHNKFENTIIDFYKKVDLMLEEFSSLYPNIPMLVISDHGHGARPVWSARINEMLFREGYLFPNKTNESRGNKRTKSWIKKYCVAIVKKVGLPKFLKNLIKKTSLWKKVFVSSSDFDWSKTTAYLSDLSAMKNYSYGGIRVVKKDCENLDKYCDEIVKKLKKYRIDDDGTPAFSWIRRTNTLYKGKYLSKYPEIIFQLDERYGANWELGDKIFEKKSLMYQFSPGAHRYETAYIGSKGFSLTKHQYEMTDVFHIILSMF